ncbi:hypothetical protein BpHYR1_006965 [Brachionus plicatilis]|uniref:Uncharacterized protein n=1 Tax=Brachionus plicatilis TaxID=10195 RepID=A0A3M7PJ17_BRAPC|nr:hypothetical protein BpHYR1_006965 [Brachionus plicatilis]
MCNCFSSLSIRKKSKLRQHFLWRKQQFNSAQISRQKSKEFEFILRQTTNNNNRTEQNITKEELALITRYTNDPG